MKRAREKRHKQEKRSEQETMTARNNASRTTRTRTHAHTDKERQQQRRTHASAAVSGGAATVLDLHMVARLHQRDEDTHERERPQACRRERLCEHRSRTRRAP